MNTCNGCGADISHKRAGAKWCSDACRVRHSYDRTVPETEKTCPTCGGTFTGNAQKVFCNASCYPERERDRRGEYDPTKHRDAMRAYQQIKKRKKIPEATKRRIFARDKYVCQICGEICDGVGKRHPRMPSIDHVTPWVLTQDDSDENLRTTHLACNRRRKWS